MSKGFASQGDLADKRESFDELAPGVYALTAEGDPNSGVVVGDDSVLVIDARATPVMAKELVAHIRKVTDKPILTTHQFTRALQSGGGGASRCRQAWSRRMPRLNRNIRPRRRLRGWRSGAFSRRAWRHGRHRTSPWRRPRTAPVPSP
jgi:hypothetical protein